MRNIRSEKIIFKLNLESEDKKITFAPEFHVKSTRGQEKNII